MYQVTIQDQQFEVRTDHQPDVLGVVNGKVSKGDLKKLGTDHYHLLADGHSYRIEILEQDLTAKTMNLRVNGETVNISAKSEFDLMLDKLGLSSAFTTAVNEVKAPMPGMVLSIKVQAGDTVAKGDTLLVLEAMKMENMLKSPVDGVIKKVAVQQGIAVEKNTVLIVFE
jgi:biotin carboxyl carrier protein